MNANLICQSYKASGLSETTQQIRGGGGNSSLISSVLSAVTPALIPTLISVTSFSVSVASVASVISTTSTLFPYCLYCQEGIIHAL